MSAAREAFETFMLDSRRNKGAKKILQKLERHGDEYLDDSVQRHWWTWQQAMESADATWRPIATAPKDGTHILVSWPMRIMDEDDMPTGEITRRDTLVTWWNNPGWIEPDYLGASGAWYGDDDSYAVDPDFWMPLAPPPKGGS